MGSPNFCRTRMDFFRINLNLLVLKEKSSMFTILLIVFHIIEAWYTKLVDGDGVIISVVFLRDMLKHSYKLKGDLSFRTLNNNNSVWLGCTNITKFVQN